MNEVAAEQELFRACEILFGAELDVSREFLEYLQWAGIKTAYRRKARETHPDLALISGKVEERQQTDLFRAVQEAYENLSNYLSARDKGFRFPRRAASIIVSQGFSEGKSNFHSMHKVRPGQRGSYQKSPHKRNGNACANPFAQRKKTTHGPFQQKHDEYWWAQASTLYKGPLPRRKLLFGHFLYYSGLIDWRTIIKALVWQRSKRPRLGEIGYRKGWLSEHDVRHILRNRNILEPFGRSAVKLKKLNNRQVRAMIEEQKKLQRKFGEFFLEHKIFTQEQMIRLLVKHKAHNAEHAEQLEKSGHR